MTRSHVLPATFGVLAVLVSGGARADAGPGSWEFARRIPVENAASRFAPRSCDLFCYVHWTGGLGVGRGLRFNNPYRLATPLEDESLSVTATYADLALGVTLGEPYGFQQGVSLNTSLALQGVPQEVIAPGYLALYRVSPRVNLRGRAALPVVLEPDLNVGGELGLGFSYWVWSGLGAYVEVVGSLFAGAATDQTSASQIPILSLQMGAAFEYEVLP